jgi:hypothetical protein
VPGAGVGWPLYVRGREGMAALARWRAGGRDGVLTSVLSVDYTCGILAVN